MRRRRRRGGFELELRGARRRRPSSPARPRRAAPAAWTGYEQLCRVRGTRARRRARARGRRARPARRTRGATRTGTRIALTRTLGAWLDDGTGVALARVRPAGAQSPRRRGGRARRCWTARGALAVDEPRLSTTYDADGRQRRAGPRAVGRRGRRLPAPRRPARSLCGTTLELGALRLDCAFFRWHMEGRDGRRALRRPAPRVSCGSKASSSRLRRRAHDAARRRRSRALHDASSASRSRRSGAAMRASPRSDGAHPLFELERGRADRARRSSPRSSDGAVARAGPRRSTLDGFGERCFAELRRRTSRLFDSMRELRERGLRLAMLTNNVREWEPLWRAMLPVDELFELVVDSGFVGHAQARAGDLRADARAPRPAAQACAVRRRHRGQLRRAREPRHARPSTSARTSRRSPRSSALIAATLALSSVLGA